MLYLDGERAVLYRSKMNPALRRNFEAMDPLEWLARPTDHIPDPGQHRTLFYGHYANRARGARRSREGQDTEQAGEESRRRGSPTWARLIARSKTNISTAPGAAGAVGRCRVTHPFHPRYGEETKFFDCRQDWSEYRVYFHDESGALTSLPAAWTSVVPPDPFKVIGGGRALFRVEDLVRLVVLIEPLRAGGRGGR